MTRTLRERVLAGDLVRGAMIFECFSPGIAQICRTAGAEFVLWDMEHTGLGFETLKSLAASCRGVGVAPMARVPRGEYHFLARALDVGCHGVMVPMVESADEARAIAEATHYPPVGRRGAAFGFAHDDYLAGDVAAKIPMLDARNIVIAQIESERGLAQVDRIAATAGVDVLWVGHFDLSNFMGIPGDFANPAFGKAIARIAAAARKHGKGLGFMPTDAAWTKRMRGLGYNMLAAGTDVGILAAGYRTLIEGMGAEA